MNHSTPGLSVHHQLLEFTQTHVHWVSDAIQPSHSLLSPSSPAPIPPSIKVFSNVSTLHMTWPKYWSFRFSIIPSKEIPGLISFIRSLEEISSLSHSVVFLYFFALITEEGFVISSCYSLNSMNNLAILFLPINKSGILLSLFVFSVYFTNIL